VRPESLCITAEKVCIEVDVFVTSCGERAIEGESKSNSLNTFAFISVCGHLMQAKIYPVVCRLYHHLRTKSLVH